MKPLFTLHAGEFLVGCEIERQLGKAVNIWIPSKDEGIDLLVTNRANTKTVSIQVKYSRDFIITLKDPERKLKLKSGGWWTFNRRKLAASKADFWVLLTYDAHSKESDFVIIPPRKLLSIFERTGRIQNIIQSYVWVTRSKPAFAMEGRDLKREEGLEMITGQKGPGIRNLTPYLSNWSQIKRKLK